MKRDHYILLAIILLVVVVLLFERYRPRQSWQAQALKADSVTRIYTIEHRKDSIRISKPLSIELNTADSVSLCRVYGIGPVFASRIIAYRTILGGYHSLDQLLEVRGITMDIYSNISTIFFIDHAQISKIDINFATQERLTSHPYITPGMARRIVRGRMKGGFESNTELLNNNILLPEEAKRLAPYLSFPTN